MDYNASGFDKTIGSKSTIVPSDHQLEYSDGQTLRFEVPAFNAFIDPRQSYLKFKVKATCSSISTFSKKTGIQSIINNVRIYDGTQAHQLENIQNYAELQEKFHHYSENQSVKNKRALLELLETTSRNYDNGATEDRSSNCFNHSQLGNGFKSGNYNALVTDANSSHLDATPNTCEVAMKLHSGILGGNRMFPALLTSGLRCEIDTNLAGKAMNLWSGAGIANADGSLVTDLPESCRFGIAVALPNGAVPVTSVVLNCCKVAGSAQTGTVPQVTAPASVAGCELVQNGLIGASNLQVGQEMFAFNEANPPVIGSLGKIVSLAYNGGGGAVATEVTVTLDGTGVNGDTLQGGAGNGTGAIATQNTCFVKLEDAIALCSYVLTDVELVLKTCNPPKSYVEKLLKQAGSEKGMTYDFLTSQTYRNNVPAGEQVSQITIPAFSERSVGAVVLPVENGLVENLSKDNMATVLDNIQTYNFIVKGQSQPTRKVEVKRLSNAVPLIEQVASWENEKTLSTCKVSVRNLDKPQENFMMCRALARYGGVYNLKEDGTLGLKAEYSVANPPVKNKLFISYIMGLRRLVVDKEGTRIEL